MLRYSRVAAPPCLLGPAGMRAEALRLPRTGLKPAGKALGANGS